jgi:hypothetical protein
MKRKNFILSAFDIVSNEMLSLKKVHVYNSASAIGVMFVLLVACMVTGCQKNSHLPEEIVQSSVINEERMSIIADLSKDYKDAIKEVLSERIKLKNSAVSSNAFDMAGRINTVYQEKCNQYGSLSDISLRSGTGEAVFDVDKLQLQLDKLQEYWDIVIQSSEEDSKEDFIAKLQKVSSDLGTSVLSDNTLTASEKQIIYENIVFRTNIVAITLQYGEDIQDFITTRGLGSWIKKNLKKIECTAKSIAAAATCAAAAVSTATGPAAIAVWAGCVSATANAAACWASI